jgi:predicted phage-related endonuclease
VEWLDGNKIRIIPPKRPKKLTGTRFATILGLNPWSTPFEIWCEVTRTYQKPFEDTIYTIAGKTIEPKQAEYMKQTYFMSNLVTPTDVWGEDYFHKTYGDFFKESPVLGGMWDYLLYGKDGKPTTVLEMKTSKRVEDWKDDIPEYYALQAALYAYLLGVDEVIMVASFLESKDYDNPEKFVCSGENTITRPFKVSERYPDFEKKYVKPALKWWKDYVESGISPAFDERKDAEILKALRTNNLSPETDMAALVKEAEDLKAKLDAHVAEVAEDEKRYKVLTDMIKKAAIAQFRDGDKKVSIAGSAYNWEVNRATVSKINKEVMKADGVLDKYTSTEYGYRISPKAVKMEGGHE